jgi:phosphoglycerate dehydrogenase-like enzyme
MLITVPSLLKNLQDRFPGTDFLIYDATSDPPAKLSETTFYIPTYMSAREAFAHIDTMTRLEVVQLLTAGYDSISDLIPEGVTLCNARGVHDASTAELAVALGLSAIRGLATFRDRQHQHLWDHREYRSLADRRVMILGYGSIGEAIERRLIPFEVEIVRVARRPRLNPKVMAFDEIKPLLPTVDMVFVVVPLTDQTRHMVDAGFLAALPDNAIVVNVARGPVVDHEALAKELRSGRLIAALDVTEPEPLPATSELWELPNCLITPHVGGDTTAFYKRGTELVIRNISRYLAGLDLINVVNLM